ncbi:hypothetical protein [Pseudomonas sp. ICMP 460]|uniref:hypothetical protein n=1 Tax=Pseudomonas sp. ICMP 460 TaxID=1718917 RepID=UPI00117BA610|nr:hypothetical protein [Pseudomonas sp. ICMP 460]
MLLINSLMGTQNGIQAIQCDGYIDLIHHLDLLVGAGYLLCHGRNPSLIGDEVGCSNEPTFYHLTWAGHDLLDALSSR